MENTSEIRIQSACFLWLWNELPQTRYLYYHVPNGGKRTPVEAMQLKAAGTIAGIPDNVFHWRGMTYFFEFKTKTGTVSQVQKQCHAALRAHGFEVHIVREVEKFKEIICSIVNKT
jgi:hypothetical protein